VLRTERVGRNNFWITKSSSSGTGDPRGGCGEVPGKEYLLRELYNLNERGETIAREGHRGSKVLIPTD